MQGALLKGVNSMQQLITGIVLIIVFFLLVYFLKSGYSKKGKQKEKENN